MDTNTARILEIGIVVFDPIKKSLLSCSSQLCWDGSYPEITEEITGITGIDLAIAQTGLPPAIGLTDLISTMQDCHYVSAHNGKAYDMPLLAAELVRHELPNPQKPLIDTLLDIPYPKKMKTRNLGHLASEHNFINPFPHRAVSDCLTAMKILSLYDWPMIEALANSPSMVIRANVSYDDRAKASERGYKWNGERKLWVKTIKEMNLDEEMLGCPFKISVISSG